MRSTHRQFRAIYRDEFAFVWAAARRFGVPLAALDDAVQEVFITAFRRLDQLSYQVSQRAWLYAVTRRVASHHHRGATRMARRVAALAEVHADAVEAPHERHDAARVLAGLLAPLPRSTREVWEMTEILGMTGPEIAAELGVPLNTVYSRLRLARAQVGRAGPPELVATSVEAARRRDAPPPEAAQRNWVVILPVLQPGGITSVVGAWATLRGVVASTLIVAGVAAISPVALVEPPMRAPSEPVAAGSPPEIAIPRAEVAPPPIVASPSRPAASRRTTAADRLAAEVALIDRARGRLAAGEPAAALALLARHAREFPDGALHDAREGASVDAWCRLGERAEAEAAARRLFTQHPDSLIAQNYEHYVCAPPAP